jgi:hypothetical protein
MPQWLSDYDVTWTTPSADASGSMPLGNGDLAANVWVEPGGDVLILLAKSDAWDENASLLKLGRLRLSLSPSPLQAGASFRQTLRLQTAEIVVSIGDEPTPTTIHLHADANDPVLRIAIDSPRPVEARLTLEHWRNYPYSVKTQTADLFKRLSPRGTTDLYPTLVTPDHFLPATPTRIAWCHHNERREFDGFEINLRLQGLSEMLEQMPHPLRGRTFGAAVCGDGFVSSGNRALVSSGSATIHRIDVHALTQHPSTIDRWCDEIDRQIEHDRSRDPATSRAAHERWWAEFWERSWVRVTPSDPTDAGNARSARDVTRAYVLQRFMNACAGRGGSPIKFNGSLFSVGAPGDPDYRRWGGPGFWFMNQRLVHWPMLAAGDFDLLKTWLRMYPPMLPMQRLRTRKHFGHGGAHFPETIMWWGAEVSAHYGWTPFEQRSSPVAECPYITWYFSGAIELTLLMFELLDFTRDEAIARDWLVPIADAVTQFYDEHYPRDPSGKIRFEPAQSLETWHVASNPLPEIAGLRYVLPKLLTLDVSLVSDALRERWRRLLEELPPLPTGTTDDGTPLLLPAETFEVKKNVENPELYAIFPYRLLGVGKPDRSLALATFAARLHREHDCWSQDDIQMALLGLAEEAKTHLTQRAADRAHSQSRFPAFWDAFHDWLPDMDHGGVLQMALQLMLVQWEGKQIRVLPAWPRGWDAEFKLHAPGKTVVTGTVRGGSLVALQVEPPSRRADVVVGHDA